MISPSHFKVTAAFLLFAAVSLSPRPSASDFAADRAECEDKLIGLADCLSYAQHLDVKSPTPECCTGFNSVVTNSFRCLCILVKDRNEPALGLQVNVSRALTLPAKCDTPTFNVTDCIKAVNVSSNSTAAKEFKQFEQELLQDDASNGKDEGNATGASNVGGAQPAHGEKNIGSSLLTNVGLFMGPSVAFLCYASLIINFFTFFN